MDQSTQQLIDKFKHNPAMAQALLQSLDGQRLMQMLTAQDSFSSHSLIVTPP